MFRNTIMLLLGMLIIGQSQAQGFQSPYRLSTAIDIPIASGAIGFLTAGALIGKTHKLPPKESILDLSRDEVNKFDRGATRNYSKGARYASDAFLYFSIASPLLHLPSANARRDYGKVAAISSEVLMLNLALTNYVKEIVRRKRPLLYNPDVPMDKKWKADNFKSFFSGHTSTVAAMGFLYANMYAQYNPNSKLKPMMWTLAALMPLTTGFLRFKAGKHYWSDIIVGYAVGTLCGLAVPYLHSTALAINRQ